MAFWIKICHNSIMIQGQLILALWRKNYDRTNPARLKLSLWRKTKSLHRESLGCQDTYSGLSWETGSRCVCILEENARYLDDIGIGHRIQKSQLPITVLHPIRPPHVLPHPWYGPPNIFILPPVLRSRQTHKRMHTWIWSAYLLVRQTNSEAARQSRRSAAYPESMVICLSHAEANE